MCCDELRWSTSGDRTVGRATAQPASYWRKRAQGSTMPTASTSCAHARSAQQCVSIHRSAPHHEKPFGRPCRTPPAEQTELLLATAVAASSTALLDCCCLPRHAAGAALQKAAGAGWPEPIKSLLCADMRFFSYQRETFSPINEIDAPRLAHSV